MFIIHVCLLAYNINPFAAGGLFGQYKIIHKMMVKSGKIIETLACGYSSESSLMNTKMTDGFQKSLRTCASDESSLSIGRVKNVQFTS